MSVSTLEQRSTPPGFRVKVAGTAPRQQRPVWRLMNWLRAWKDALIGELLVRTGGGEVRL
jgi:hypothetical protein